MRTRARRQVSGVEGNFRSTCESVMGVLRSNKLSVLAMLEAFVHDPLINWRLLARRTRARRNTVCAYLRTHALRVNVLRVSFSRPACSE
eukprot:2800984-Pleurochrysis_carterae.AAC.1